MHALHAYAFGPGMGVQVGKQLLCTAFNPAPARLVTARFRAGKGVSISNHQEPGLFLNFIIAGLIHFLILSKQPQDQG